MRSALLIGLILLAPVLLVAQDQQSVDELRSTVRDLADRKGKAAVLTRSLVKYSGKIVSANKWRFEFKLGKVHPEIEYEDVLVLTTGDKAISFIPDETTRNYGRWQDINRVFPGTKIAIVLIDGKTIKGFANSATSEKIVMVDHNGRERVEVGLDRIAAYFGLIGGYGGVKKGASKGAEAMNSGRDKLPGMVFAGIGALIGMAKSDGQPILIYSR